MKKHDITKWPIPACLFIGIELLEEYCKIAEERIQKELSQTKLNTKELVSIPPTLKGLGILSTRL